MRAAEIPERVFGLLGSVVALIAVLVWPHAWVALLSVIVSTALWFGVTQCVSHRRSAATAPAVADHADLH
ncbi:MAG TPA: hypothetical protein VKV22_05175, partial [Rhodanobacteraceae bacterium]|nr:hypothetical protein [Rhodanobacteraceae bacterium]